jgi:hypothetical protein
VRIIVLLVCVGLGGLMLRWIIEGAVENGVTNALRRHQEWLEAHDGGPESSRDAKR